MSELHEQKVDIDVEKVESHDNVPSLSKIPLPEEEIFEEKKDLKRGLEQRHIQMIALAGTIGTVSILVPGPGLFLGSGRALATGGPAGVFLGYLLTGLLVSGVVISIAEMSALVPLSGSIIRQAEYFFDPALSFAQGWNTVYSFSVGIPAEIVAAGVLIEFWVPSTEVSSAVWITVLGLLTIGTSLLLIRVYGELEFGFAILKILLIMGLIIMGLCIDLGGVSGQPRLGFHYWRDPGPFVQYLSIPGPLGRFCGFWTTFSNAAYAYSGVESIANAAAETHNPRRNIPKAAKRIFVRILIFYVLSIFVVTLLVPSNSEELLSAQNKGNAAQSPFVIAASLAGIKVVPHIVNAVVLTSAWSAANSGMLTATRTLYGLAREGHAPKFLLWTNRFGIPYLCVLCFGAFIALGYMTLSNSASIVFSWFQDLVSTAVLVQWCIICLVYLRFYYACKRQQIDRNTELPWAGPFQPYAAWISLLSFGTILLTAGYPVFIKSHWSTEEFIGAYFNLPLIFGLYFGYKWAKGTKVVSLDEMPVRYYVEIAKENPEEEERSTKGWNGISIIWS
ncbi:amino acid permease/ SLC12A domain-containing protein [Lentinula raphanica]|nr:amino acid permease/ SLC12A domain-containing protein [Lentinula raphanica]